MHAGSQEDPTRARGPHRVRFRVERADEIATAHGLEQVQDKAAFFGAHPTTYSRIVRGLIDPGEAFIAAVLGSNPGDPDISFDALFEVVEVAAA